MRHACKALDTARCGIVMAMSVLRLGRDDPIRLDRAVPRMNEHSLRNPSGQPCLTCGGRTAQTAPDTEKVCPSASVVSSDRRTMPHHSRSQPRSAAHSPALRTKHRIRIRHNPVFGIVQRILSRMPYSERPQMRASSMAPCLKFHCAKPPRGSLEAYVF